MEWKDDDEENKCTIRNGNDADSTICGRAWKPKEH